MNRFLKDVIKIIIHYVSLVVAHIITPRKKLNELENSKKDSTIYCVGGGPSMNLMDLSLLNGQNVILTNFSYKILDKCKPGFSISFAQDTRRIEEMKKVDRDLFDFSLRTVYGRPILLLKFLWNQSFTKKDLLIIPKTYGIFRDTDWKKEDLLDGHKINGNIQIGYSIIYSAIQLAYYMGAKRIVLIGVDLNYTGAATHFDENRSYERSLVDNALLEKMMNNLKDLTDALKEKGVEIYNTSTLTNETYTQKITLEEAVRKFKN